MTDESVYVAIAIASVMALLMLAIFVIYCIKKQQQKLQQRQARERRARDERQRRHNQRVQMVLPPPYEANATSHHTSLQNQREIPYSPPPEYKEAPTPLPASPRRQVIGIGGVANPGYDPPEYSAEIPTVSRNVPPNNTQFTGVNYNNNRQNNNNINNNNSSNYNRNNSATNINNFHNISGNTSTHNNSIYSNNNNSIVDNNNINNTNNTTRNDNPPQISPHGPTSQQSRRIGGSSNQTSRYNTGLVNQNQTSASSSNVHQQSNQDCAQPNRPSSRVIVTGSQQQQQQQQHQQRRDVSPLKFSKSFSRSTQLIADQSGNPGGSNTRAARQNVNMLAGSSNAATSATSNRAEHTPVLEELSFI